MSDHQSRLLRAHSKINHHGPQNDSLTPSHRSHGEGGFRSRYDHHAPVAREQDQEVVCPSLRRYRKFDCFNLR